MSGPTILSTAAKRLGGRWAAQRDYATLPGWFADVYDEVLKRTPGLPLPRRRAVQAIRLAGRPGPYMVRLGTTDLDVLNEVYFHGEYDAVVALELPPSPFIVDLGSNIGLSIRLWKQHWPDARVIGVEPDAGNAAMCRRNAEFAGGPKVPVYEVCIAGRSRAVQLDRSRGEWGFAIQDSPAEVGGSPMEAITIPELLTRAGIEPGREIDLLKCDIEGAEREVFEHCAGWIGRVRAAVVELHAPYTLADLTAALRGAGASFAARVLKSSPGIEVVLLTRAAAAR